MTKGDDGPRLAAEQRARGVESERWKSFTYDELVARDKANLDLTWLRDESLEDTENLPAPGDHRPRDRR